jgi:GT2 family glycosyltransferase
MRFSIIIVTHNGLHHLQPCLTSLIPQLTSDWDVVIVDNASTDGTAEFVESLHYPAVSYVRLATNTGFASANNKGGEVAAGDYLFLLNNDTVVEVGTLAALEESVAHFPEFQIFACRMVRASDGKIDNMGIRFSRLLRASQIGTGNADAWLTAREVFGASGGAMLVRRSVIADVGLFDPIFFAYHEDVDFALRARIAGYRCLYVPQAIVHHKGGGTSSSNASLYRYYIQRNMELAILRNVPPAVLWKYGLGRLAYSIFQIVKWSLKGNGLLVLRAKLDAISLWRRTNPLLTPKRINTHQFERFLADDFSPLV